MMERITIDADMLRAAGDRLDVLAFDAQKRGAHQYGSEVERTIGGYIGEQAVATYLDAGDPEDDYEFDFDYFGHKLEVKTIVCTSEPRPHYLCTVNSCDLDGVRKQHADWYVFVRVLKNHSAAWIVGTIRCEDFFARGRFVPKGSKIDNGVTFSKANATVLEIAELLPPRYLFTLLPRAERPLPRGIGWGNCPKKRLEKMPLPCI
jgi:hypothetical protein